MRVVFGLPSGDEVAADAAEGDTVMRVALAHDVPGIYGDCGGQCACATCHVYIREDWMARVGPAATGSTEESMLEGAPVDIAPTSRLTCQIVLTADLDGLSVLVPPGQ